MCRRKLQICFDRGFLVKDKDGNAIRMIGAIQDVTRQKEEEQRLKLLETVITQTKDAVIITESEKSETVRFRKLCLSTLLSLI